MVIFILVEDGDDTEDVVSEVTGVVISVVEIEDISG
jgi:hypothetical protein